MKEITLRYKTKEELEKMLEDNTTFRDASGCIDLYIDGERIDNVKSFSITIDNDQVEPLYKLERYMSPDVGMYDGVLESFI